MTQAQMEVTVPATVVPPQKKDSRTERDIRALKALFEAHPNTPMSLPTIHRKSGVSVWSLTVRLRDLRKFENGRMPIKQSSRWVRGVKHSYYELVVP